MKKEKKLDREDIESLGWDLDQTVKGDSFFYHKDYNLMSEMEPCLCFTPKNEKNVNIYDISPGKSMNVELTVNNKSELKKEMKKLNIITK